LKLGTQLNFPEVYLLQKL